MIAKASITEKQFEIIRENLANIKEQIELLNYTITCSIHLYSILITYNPELTNKTEDMIKEDVYKIINYYSTDL